MGEGKAVKTIFQALLTVALVAALSFISARVWSSGGQKAVLPGDMVIGKDMTVAEFGRANNLPGPVLKEIFRLQSRSDLERKLSEYGTGDGLTEMITKRAALAAEGSSKNWPKIAVKFALWFAFLSFVFFFLRRRKVTPRTRKALLGVSLFIFGVVLGSDPGPMGTVKDAVHLYGSTGAVFPPRMIALAVFLAMVLIANKYICAWGCQAGTLQDFLFRLNESTGGRAITGKRIRVPFVVSNGIRIIFFAIFTAVSFLWGLDIVEPVDIFRVYKPASLGIFGALFLIILLAAGLFIYRPWCHFFCPFGLVGWIVEKASLVRISVDYDTCIACKKCTAACPSTVMSAILLDDKKTIPDCFACYSCRDACPTGSIRFSMRRRNVPPNDHFSGSR